ncbi:MAG TPA: ATP-binding protein [Verrucomicrobiota bacterium]|nr:ATP-binding protein [Verrucomicrobiota bacterium]
MRFVLGVLILTVAAATWMHMRAGQPSVRNREHAPPATSIRPERWLIPLSAGGAAISAALLLGAMARLVQWRRTWSERLTANEEESRKALTLLKNQLAESRLAEERLQKAHTELAETVHRLKQTNAELQGELDQRRIAEKALQQHRQELVRSKDVLELHVQARTQELQKLQRRYEMILNSAGEGICSFDITGRATFVNPAAARMTGWDASELVGRQEHEIFGQRANAETSSDATGKDRVFRRRDGTTFPAEVVKTPIHENGREVGAVVIFKDITERKRAEEIVAKKAAELARSNAELEQFAFVASHDLQEPLRKIQAFGDRLKARCDAVDLGEARDYLERMQSAAARMQTLINDLLAFSRVIRSSQPFTPVDLTAVTREVLGDLEVRIEKTGGKVEIGSLPTIEADATQMRQLMQNLISNALKFQPPGATPVVRIDSTMLPEASLASGPLCQITVQDNGIGFDEKYMDKVFAVFQRLHGRSEYEGTGVGLAVCRRIVDRHGGTITAKSKPGEGATFIVTLPVRQPRKEKTV